MLRRFSFCTLSITIAFLFAFSVDNKNAINSNLDKYKITWTSQSVDSWGSMPLSGKFGAGANVWCEDGAIWIYAAHNEAYDEEGRLLKLGAIRLYPNSDLLKNPSDFNQTLDINNGCININATSQNGQKLKAKLWFADQNLIIETTTSHPETFQVDFMTWRDKTRDSMHIDMGKRIDIVRADHVELGEDGFVWYHNNSEYPGKWKEELKKQVIEDVLNNPADGNIFGGAIVSKNKLTPIVYQEEINPQIWHGAKWSAKSAPAKDNVFVVALRAGKDQNKDEWKQEARQYLSQTQRKKSWSDNIERWKDFWNRSYIFVNKDKNETDSAWILGRNYQLFRYMLATNQNGKLPLLFNGGIFTMDNHNHILGNNNDEINRTRRDPSSPDQRHWLFCNFMAQNQRWLGWPTIAAGDYDLLEANNGFYRMHSPAAASRAAALGAKGNIYPEAINVWGLTWAPTNQGLCGAAHLKYDFSMTLENAWMALHGHSVLNKDISDDIEWIKGIVIFYDSYYRKKLKEFASQELDENNKLVIYPANSVEHLVGAQNPTEVIAGLKRISDALTKLPDDLVSTDEKEYFRKVYETIPEISTDNVDGKEIMLAAKSYIKMYNLWEIPEFYAAWPYRLNSVCNPGSTQIMQNTIDKLPKIRSEKSVDKDYSWMPNVVNMAAIGNTKEASRLLLNKLGNFNGQCRFPAFFGPGHDWVPDHNWGGTAMVGMQEMLMAADPYGDGKIYLLPAWPKDWDVDFKLHAPNETTVEVSVKSGKIQRLKVFPQERMADIIINPDFHLL